MLSIINALRAILLVAIFTITSTITCFANTETTEVTIPPSGGMSAMKKIETDTRLYIFSEYKNGKPITKSDELSLDPKMNFPKELVGIKNIEEFPALVSAFQKYQQGYSVEFTPDMLHKKTEEPQTKPEVVEVIAPIKTPTISLFAKEDLSFEITSNPEIPTTDITITITDQVGKIITELNTAPYKWTTENQETKGNYLAQAKLTIGDQTITSNTVPIVVQEKTIVTKSYPEWLTVNNLLITTGIVFLLVLYLIFYKALPMIQWLVRLNKPLSKTTG